LEARVAASPLGVPRVGLIVARHGRSAVLRNQLKRRLRELVRTQLLPALAGGDAPPVDVAVRTTPAAYTLSFEALRREFEQVSARVLRAAREG